MQSRIRLAGQEQMPKVRKTKNLDITTALNQLRKEATLRTDYDNWMVEMSILSDSAMKLISLRTDDKVRRAAQEKMYRLLGSAGFFNGMMEIYAGRAGDGAEDRAELLNPFAALIAYKDDAMAPVRFSADGKVCVVGNKPLLQKLGDAANEADMTVSYEAAIVVWINESASNEGIFATLKCFEDLLPQMLKDRQS